MLVISVFSLCLVDGTHREHVQLVEVDAPEVAQVDGTLSMLGPIKNTQFKIGSWQVADFEVLYFVRQVCHGELNGSVDYTYIRLCAV